MLDEEAAGPAVVCRLGQRLFAVSADLVESMVQLSEVTELPDTPAYVRGVITLRGSVVKVVDLRSRLGLPTLHEEVQAFTQMLDERQADHERWLAQLRASVSTRTAFAGQLDPTKCAFGKWYATFKTDDVILTALLNRFDAPHRAIHAAAHKVADFMREQRFADAERVINEAESRELKALIELFTLTKEAYVKGNREIAIVMADGERRCATVVDQVVSVEHLEQVSDGASAVETYVSMGLVEAISMRPRHKDQLVLNLLPDAVLAA